MDELIEQWVLDQGLSSIQLFVTHSHGHGDHVAADHQFGDRPHTTIVPTGQTDVANFFGIGDWPHQTVSFELTNRTLKFLPLPGHFEDHIAVYDEKTGLLLTGDTVYPGNLYIRDFAAYKASIQRLVDFCGCNEVRYVLGTHIEMTNRPRIAFDFQSTYHPNEHVLQLTPNHLVELNRALLEMGSDPVEEKHDDFIIVPV